MSIGGHQVSGEGTGDDGFDEEGYDESQRAEILEVTREGPSDGTLLTDLNPDIATSGDEDEEEDGDDDLESRDDEIGEEDEDADESEADEDEDDVQDELDDGTIDEDTLSDRDAVALQP